MALSVRRALLTDLDWLLAELRKFADFAATRFDLMGDAEHARKQMTHIIENHLVFVTEDKDHGLTGFIAGLVTDHFFNPAIRTLTEVFWWVKEEFRATRAALLLLNAFTDWGREHANWIVMALEAKSPVNERTLEKRGYHLHERSFLLEAR